MVSIQDPLNPTAAGCFSADGYTHDAQCVTYTGPDADHQGKEICLNSNEDTLTIVDVTIKATPVQLSRTAYTHAHYPKCAGRLARCDCLEEWLRRWLPKHCGDNRPGCNSSISRFYRQGFFEHHGRFWIAAPPLQGIEIAGRGDDMPQRALLNSVQIIVQFRTSRVLIPDIYSIDNKKPIIISPARPDRPGITPSGR